MNLGIGRAVEFIVLRWLVTKLYAGDNFCAYLVFTPNMVLKGRLKPEKEAYYQQQIQNTFPDNFFDAPSEIVAAMTNAETDRHVAATAIVSQAQYIVTFNLKDFSAKSLLAYNIEAIHPDRFLELLCDDWGDLATMDDRARIDPI